MTSAWGVDHGYEISKLSGYDAPGGGTMDRVGYAARSTPARYQIVQADRAGQQAGKVARRQSTKLLKPSTWSKEKRQLAYNTASTAARATKLKSFQTKHGPYGTEEIWRNSRTKALSTGEQNMHGDSTPFKGEWHEFRPGNKTRRRVAKRWIGAQEAVSQGAVLARARNPIQTFGVPAQQGRVAAARKANKQAGFFYGAKQGKRVARGG